MAPYGVGALELSAESGSISAGSAVTVTLTVRPLNGFTGGLRLTVASLPRGVTSSLGLKTIVSAGDSIDVTFTADDNPRIGSVTLTFTGQTILGAVPATTSTADYDLHVETFSWPPQGVAGQPSTRA